MRARSSGLILGVLGCLLFPGATELLGQRTAAGPWWPHPKWGAEDQAGGSNWITPEKVLDALLLVKTGQIYELGHVYERGMPLGAPRTYTLVIPGSPTFGPLGKNAVLGHDEVICAHLGQIGTQFDGPGHIGMRIALADGTTQDVFYNGVTLEEMRNPYGLRKLGVENVKPYFTRGILIDLAGYKGMPTLPNRYEVSVADVRGALARQGIREEQIQPGDALFFNYGWSKLWRESQRYNQSPPGIGLEVARWIIDRQASVVGSDALGTEVMQNPDPQLAVPVHQELIMKNGIFNIENMIFEDLLRDNVYEFLFVFTPVRFKGATGSPGRPLAIR